MTRKEILDKASEYINKDRTAVHGEPENNFATIANLSGIYLTAIYRKRKNSALFLEPHDIAILNILQKVARIVQSPEHLDHWIDIAGYAACGGEIVSIPGSPSAHAS